MEEMQECMKLAAYPRRQKFMGEKYCKGKDAVNNMISGMSFSMAILREKDVEKREGVVVTEETSQPEITALNSLLITLIGVRERRRGHSAPCCCRELGAAAP